MRWASPSRASAAVCSAARPRPTSTGSPRTSSATCAAIRSSARAESAVAVLRVLPDQHHEHRHQWQRHRDQAGREQVGPREDEQQDRRDDERLRQRREVGGQRRPEVVQPGGRQYRGRPRTPGRVDRGGGVGEPVQQRAAEDVLGAAGIAGGEHLARRPGARAQRHPGGGEHQRDGGRARGQAGRPGHRVRQTGRQQHDADRLRQRGEGRADQRPAQPRDAGQRPERPPPRRGASGPVMPADLAGSSCTGSAVSRLRNTQYVQAW